MVGRTEIVAVKEEGLEDLTVSELVTSLKAAFQNAYFTQVEEVLVSREQKLKTEIEGKNRENEFLLEKLQRFKESDSGELKELVTRLKEERDGLLNIMEEYGDNKKEILELQGKNHELECAKRNAETQLYFCRGTIKEDRDELLKIAKQNEDLKKEILVLKRKNRELECAKLNVDSEVDVCKGRIKGLDESGEEDDGKIENGANAAIVEIMDRDYESSSLERGKRVKVEEPIPFASPVEPAILNMTTRYIGKGET
ncbi:uncharacterized protein [Euphorbia lathyris]|uniref:uncharacterized protein n=1 Tax=Euphorbia lathyris TaxID=212925 RepID=UPI003313FED9